MQIWDFSTFNESNFSGLGPFHIKHYADLWKVLYQIQMLTSTSSVHLYYSLSGTEKNLVSKGVGLNERVGYNFPLPTLQTVQYKCKRFLNSYFHSSSYIFILERPIQYEVPKYSKEFSDVS
jgi:hypothetical protein